VERSFTCRQLVELWQEVVNLKNEIDRKKVVRLFGEEFHTPCHIFLCIKNTSGLKLQNGHTKLSMVFAKLVNITLILACQNPFYKTSSIPKLLS
jgi:3,4-dihydroxy 2-butanone 4-phosphate synthase